jgi:hypothetical protein
VVIVWLGLFPGPVLRRIEPSSERFIELVRLRVPGVATPASPTTVPLGGERAPSVP